MVGGCPPPDELARPAPPTGTFRDELATDWVTTGRVLLCTTSVCTGSVTVGDCSGSCTQNLWVYHKSQRRGFLQATAASG